LQGQEGLPLNRSLPTYGRLVGGQSRPLRCILHVHAPPPRPRPSPRQIVPEDMRSLVYAFDRSLESSLAACAAPAVGLLAERLYGFSGAVSRDALSDAVLRSRNAGALGSSLLLCMAVPWTACLLFYTVLHWTYVSGAVGAPARARAASAATRETGRLAAADAWRVFRSRGGRQASAFLGGSRGRGRKKPNARAAARTRTEAEWLCGYSAARMALG
jgi:hypothetical protein